MKSKTFRLLGGGGEEAKQKILDDFLSTLTRDQIVSITQSKVREYYIAITIIYKENE